MYSECSDIRESKNQGFITIWRRKIVQISQESCHGCHAHHPSLIPCYLQKDWADRLLRCHSPRRDRRRCSRRSHRALADPSQRITQEGRQLRCQRKAAWLRLGTCWPNSVDFKLQFLKKKSTTFERYNFLYVDGKRR